MLTQEQKELLFKIDNGLYECPRNMDFEKFSSMCRTLERYEYVKCAKVEGGGVIEVRITDKGQSYLTLKEEHEQLLKQSEEKIKAYVDERLKQQTEKEQRERRKEKREQITLYIGLITSLIALLEIIKSCFN